MTLYLSIPAFSFTVDGGAALPATKRPTVQMPDEYLPPNKILFLQNLPDSVTKEQLNALFSQLRIYSFFVSCCLAPFLLNNTPCPAYAINLPLRPFIDTPIFTKSVSSQQKKILPLWNSWTREVPPWRKTHFTIISWMGRTRSKCDLYLLRGCLLIF